MTRKLFYLIPILIFLLAGFLGCAKEETPFFGGSTTSLSKEAINKAIEATVLISIDDNGAKQIIGRGMIVGEKYVLTANHVVSAIPNASYYLLINNSYYGPVKPIFAKSGFDFALLEIPDGQRFPSLELGNSDNLEPGALIYYIGFQNKIEEKILKKGKLSFITSLSLEFSPSQKILFGESGAPVLMVENGKLKVIGILQSTNAGQSIGIAHLINPIVSTILKESGINLSE